MPTRFLLLRHAESTHPNVFNGFESDVGLSDRGRRQAEALAPVLAALKPDALVSSGMARALATARPAALACGLGVRVEPDLHERRVGALNGTTDEQSGGLWAETLRRWKAGELEYAPEGAESFAAVRRRVLPVWERLAGEYEGRTVAVVTHGQVCRVLLLSILPGLSAADWHEIGPVRNAAVNELVRAGGAWQAVRLDAVPDPVEQIDRAS